MLTAILAFVISGRGVFPDNPTTDFKSVGEIGNAIGGTFDLKGCGVAIAPTYVIGAAHVGGNTFIEEGKQYPIAKKIFFKTDQGEPADLAIYKLASPVPDHSAILYAPFDGASNALKGQTVYLVGYGETCRLRSDGKGWEPVKGSTGVKRVATNTIDHEIPDRINFGTDAAPKWHTSQALVYDIDDPSDPKKSTLGTKITKEEGGVADKDSGGGWFVKVNGKEELVAVSESVGRIVSMNLPSPYCYGGLGFGIHLQPYKAWIEKTISGK